MKKREKLNKLLIEEPRARERKNKDRAIVNLLIKEYGWLDRLILENPKIKDSVIRLVGDYGSYDRLWRDILKKNKKLRGSDYGDKVKLEQEKMIELGYQAPMSNEEWKSLADTLERQNT